MKKITKQKPYFDEQGNFYIPKNIKMGGELNPKLKIGEWFYLLFQIADKKTMKKEIFKKILSNVFGSKSNQYRIKKSLKEKGYL